MEQSATVIAFGPFRLLPAQRQLWKDEERIELRPTSLAVLTYLAQQPERVVAIEELRQAVWGSTYVSRTTIRVCLREVRQALGDEAATPCYIATVGRQGYCFIGFRGREGTVGSDRASAGHHSELLTESLSPPVRFVGRQRELAQLQRWFARAQQGQRQVVLVSGEPGIGKTTLVNQFVAQLPATAAAWVGLGQCIESYEQGEAYLPILEALGRLGREQETEQLAAVLHQHAPTWLMHLPALMDVAARETPHRQVAGATQERMLRELCDALEVLTVRQPLLLVLEDLHWSDTATLAWLAALARRPSPARLFVIGTYRPTDVIMHPHPLRGLVQELRAHRLCRDMQLEGLSADEVREYVYQRFTNMAVADELGLRLYKRTDGNPLFLAASVDTLIQRGLVGGEGERWVVRGDSTAIEGTMPEDLRHLITKQIETLSAEEQQMLAVASVSGRTFAAAAVAASCQEELEVVEEACERLAQHGQMIKGGTFEEWPDGTSTARYSFRHALFREVLYQRLGDRRRIRLHRALAERLEAGYGGRAREVASTLAGHFTQGRDYHKGAKYHQHAADNALRLSAYHEAIAHCQQGLALLAHVPATSEHDRQELTLQVTLGVSLQATKGFAAPEVERAYARARELCQQVGETSQLFPVLWGLWAFYLVRAENEVAHELGERLLTVAQSVRGPAFLLQAHYSLGVTLVNVGKLTLAREHLEQSLVFYDPQQHHIQALLYGAFDPKVAALSFAALVLWLLGYPDQAWNRSQEALVLAQELSHPFSLAFALDFAIRLHQFRREGQAAQERAEADITLSTEQGFPYWLAQGTIVRGWALAQQGQGAEGIAQVRQGISAQRAGGTRVTLPYYISLLAEAYGEAGRVAEGLDALAEALTVADKTGERYYEAELYRLAGELSLRIGETETGRTGDVMNEPGSRGAGEPETENSSFFPDSPVRRFSGSSSAFPVSSPEECFHKAIKIARKQQAKSLELRAVMSLSRLWQSQGKKKEAHQMLAEIYGWFSEGFDTKDLQEAKALLVQLA